MKDPMGVWIATGALGRVRLLRVPNTCGDAGAAKGDGTGIYGNTLV